MDRPNIVLIVMDTARAKSVLGRPDVMPNLHRIADQGVTFTNAFATAPWTLPSHASLFTGQYTTDHGTHAGSTRFDPGVETLAERLSEAGYATTGYSNNTWISPDFGFDRGFDEFLVGWQLFDRGSDLASIGRAHERTTARLRALSRHLVDREAPYTLLNAAFAQILRKRYDDGATVTNWRLSRRLRGLTNREPFFLFVNYLEPHLEYDPPELYRDRFLPEHIDPDAANEVNQDAWAYLCGQQPMDAVDFETLRASYEGELAYLDHKIGALYDRLDERGLLEETVLILTSDHGENIGDHGLMDHQYSLYDTLLHVPLVIHAPTTFEGGEARAELVELRDLYPTMLELAGAPTSPRSGHAPRSLLGESHREAVFAEYVTPQPSMEALAERVGHLPESVRSYDRGLRAVRTTEWKYIRGSDGGQELFRHVEDPAETTDLSASHPEVARELAGRMEAVLGGDLGSSGESEQAIDSGTKQRLAELGYLQ